MVLNCISAQQNENQIFMDLIPFNALAWSAISVARLFVPLALCIKWMKYFFFSYNQFSTFYLKDVSNQVFQNENVIFKCALTSHGE